MRISGRAHRTGRGRWTFLAVTLAVTVAACSGAPTSAPIERVSPSTASVAFPAPPGTALPAGTATALQDEIERWVETGQLPGVTAAVVTDQGSWSGAAGVDGQRDTLDATSGMGLIAVEGVATSGASVAG